MAERMTSPEEAAMLKARIGDCVDALECSGFGRGQIGSAMAGIGLALTQVHSGHREAIHLVDTVRNLLLADVALKS